MRVVTWVLSQPSHRKGRPRSIKGSEVMTAEVSVLQNAKGHRNRHHLIIHTGLPSVTASFHYSPQTATWSSSIMAILTDRTPPHHQTPWKQLYYHNIPLSSTMAFPMDITPPHHACHWKPPCQSYRTSHYPAQMATQCTLHYPIIIIIITGKP